MSQNESIDKLAEQYTETESETKAYSKAQQAVIVTQSKEIATLRKQKEQLEAEVEKMQMENIRLKAANPSGQSQFEASDEETICVVQIAILKNLAMQRELTLEETKKTEIYCKILQTLRSKTPEKEEHGISGVSSEELLKMMNDAMKGDPQ